MRTFFQNAASFTTSQIVNMLNSRSSCRSMFGLRVIRHRYFECSFPLTPPAHKHAGSLVTGEHITVTGHCGIPAWTMREREKRGLPRHMPDEMKPATRSAAMGIDWMSMADLSQAIPPAYSEFIGRAFLASKMRDVA